MSDYIFKLPDLGEGTVEAEIAEWMVKVGDTVAEEDTICAMLTDKAAVELSAPVSGQVRSLAGNVGDTISVGAALITFALDSDAAASQPVAAIPALTPASDKPTTPVSTLTPTADAPADRSNDKVKTSPSIRQRAREARVDLAEVVGSGPGGRILKQDIDAFIFTSSKTAQPAHSGISKASGSTEIKVVGLRRKIAQRMEQANQQIPHFAYVEEVDITALESLRQDLNSNRSQQQGTLTLLPFIAMALCRVLKDFPQCNSHYDSERNVLIQHNAIHLGIATQTDDGLKVAVVQHAEARALESMATEIRRVSSAARDNSAGRDDLSGSTITLTSLGKLGGVVSTPIINLPEVAIVGVNKAIERPVALNGQIGVRLMMNLSSSFDHRFVDGYDAAAMIQALKLLLEQPATIFIRD